MAFSPVKVFAVTMTSGATFSNSADLGTSFNRMYLQIPTMASGSLHVNGSVDNSNFFRIMRDQGNTTTVHSTFVIDSSVTQRIVPIPGGIRYMRVESTSGCTDVVSTLYIIGGD